MKILISAAETSSDLHGAQLLSALKRECAREGEGIEAFGIGGPKLQEAGLRAVVDARTLLAMGFTEVFGRLPVILRALGTTAREAERMRPEIAVVIDYPEFHFRLAKKLKRLGIPVIYFIPPKVWVWRKGRIRILRERFVRVLSIFPFEVEFYRKERMPVTYVGNPLADELPLKLGRQEARRQLSLGEGDPVLLLMPGSRPSELKYHLELMLEAAVLAARELRARGLSRVTVLIPLPLTAPFAEVENRISKWKAGRDLSCVELLLSQGNAYSCMAAADAALIKSGTSTLEAAMMGCVHSIIYRSNLLSHFIFRALVRYKGPVGLVNLVAGWEPGKPLLVREILHHGQTSRELADELLSLFGDPDRRRRIQEGMGRVRRIVLEGNTQDAVGPGVHLGVQMKSPSEVAAREILSWVRSSRAEAALEGRLACRGGRGPLRV